MRIAYVINSVEGGGAALPAPSVASVLQAHGAHVEVFALTRRDGRALSSFERSGLEAHVRAGGEKDHLRALLWLGEQLRRWKPDVIWTSLTRATLLGQVVGERLKVPVVSWQHNAFLKPANRWLLRARQKSSRLWVADSYSVQALTATRLGIDPGRLMLWPLFAADPGAPVAQAWRPGEPVRLGSLGRLHPAKGYDVLIAAFAHLQANGFRPAAPMEMVIAGEGEERARLQALVRDSGVTSIVLAGFNPDPRAFLATRRLYVQPSRAEGLCIAAHEAMQAGLPVVASAVGELAHSVVDGATGFLVRPDDPVALAGPLATLLGDPQRLAAMGAASRSRVLDRFSASLFEASGAAILDRLAAGRSR